MIKISVIIPCYKYNKYLLKTLFSIKNQKKKPFEIIIVFSNKINLNQKKKLFKNFKNLKIFYLKNGNASKNRNFGSKKAFGKYLAFCDDDDIWEKNYLKEVVKKIHKDHTLTVLTWLNKIKKDKISKFKSIEENISKDVIFQHNPGIIGSNIVISKKIFFQLKGFDEKLSSSEDKDFLLRLLYKKIPYKVIKTRLVFHRQNKKNSLSFDIKGKERFLKKHFKKMSKRNIYTNQQKIFYLKLKRSNLFLKIYWAIQYTIIHIKLSFS